MFGRSTDLFLSLYKQNCGNESRIVFGRFMIFHVSWCRGEEKPFPSMGLMDGERCMGLPTRWASMVSHQVLTSYLLGAM